MTQSIGNGIVGNAGKLAALMTLSLASSVWATVEPPVKIVVPRDRLHPAISGQEYSGAIEIKVGAAGQLDDFQISGEGWRASLPGTAGPVDVLAGTSHVVEFKGTPLDDSKPLYFSLTFDGRPVRKRIDLGQMFFANAGKPGKVATLDAMGRVTPFRADQLAVERSSTNTAGQSLHLFGRIAYQRPTSPSDGTLITVGTGSLWYEIMDQDDVFDETIFSGYTDAYGYFELNISWDDCDVSGCDDPDIYIRWETDNNVVNVQRDDVLEEDYSWSTADDPWDDFDGSEINFGTLMPGDPAQYPALHIHNSIMRAYHYILLQSGTGIDVEEVDVQWPEDPDRSFYTTFYEEIHIGSSRQWNEDTHTHEYGHHFLENYSVNPEPDYCNGVCDTDDNCGHCSDCSETDHDAWNEGWPNWLADVVTRSYPLDYQFDDGTPFQPYGRRSQESISTTCSSTGMPNDPLRTESYAGAICRDIEDGAQDDHSGGTFNCNGPPASLDCTADALALGVDEIFTVVTQDQPSTPLGFLQAFRNRYPQFEQDLWSTATNVDPAYSFVPPAPVVISQAQDCKMDMAGRPLSLNVQGDGSALRYQWERFNADVNNDAVTTGAQCSTLTFNPLTAAHAGIYRAEVSTCDQSSSTVTDPIRVTVFPARGDGTWGSGFGRNDVGQLGIGITTPGLRPYPTAIPLAGLADVVQISSADFASIALRSDGTVWAWGFSRHGPGSPSSSFSTISVQVPNISDVIAVSAGGGAGWGHNLALKADGTVWGWGYNSEGQVGTGNYNSPQYPVKLGLDCATSIAAGSRFSLFLRSDGTVWSCGLNTEGELGRPTPGPWTAIIEEVPGLNDVVAIAAGGEHALALRSNGTVFAWGRNNQGQLGDGTLVSRAFPSLVSNLSSVTSIEAGVYHSLAIRNDGTVRAWGYNVAGQLGFGVNVREALPGQPVNVGTVRDVAGGSDHTLFARTDGTLWTTGSNHSGEGGHSLNAQRFPIQIPQISGVFDVEAGDTQSFVLNNGVPPSIIIQPVNKTVLAGQPVQFTVTALGIPSLSYQWSQGGSALSNGGNVSGATSTTVSIDPVTLTIAGAYTVRIENSFGFADSVQATLTVNCPNGDGDCDGVIDPKDAANLAQCLGGPGGPRPPACEAAEFGNFDANNDNDVDLRDAAVLQRCFAGVDFIDPACGQ